MDDPEAFLRDVAKGLPFGEAECAEILEELRAHVVDSTAELQAEGLPPAVAQRTALDRLGSPERLAQALTEARHSRRRLLAAAGAGSWAVVTSGIYGWFVGLVLAVFAWLGTVAVVRFVGPFAFDSVSFIAIGVAIYSAGSAVTPVVAARAGYRAARVRWVLAGVGAILLAAYALIGWSGPLDAVGVGAVFTLPAWWVLGTWRRSRLRRGSARTFALLFVVAIGAIVATQVAQIQIRDSGRVVAGDPTGGGELGLSRIAAPAPAVISTVVTGEGHASIGGPSGVTAGTFIVDVSDASVLSGWHDLRVEAWRAVDPGSESPTPVSPNAAAPFVVAPAVWSPPGELPGGMLTWSSSEAWGPKAMTLSGAVRLDRTPWVTAAWVALTGVAPDGSRHLIVEPDYVQAIFNGTALEWLEAVITQAPER